MSGSWIRGPRCGVDNCRSKYYKSVDGRRVCQYGHVNEGHVDYNDDDDDNFVVTRRLNIPQSTAGMSQGSQITPGLEKDESKRKLFGAAARDLYFKCFQSLLKLQLKSLVEEHNVPKVIETAVKSVYIQYLNSFFKDDAGPIFSGYESADTQFTNNEDEDMDTRTFRFKKLPGLVDSLAICYLACRYLHFPVYLNDFITWCTTRKIPFMRASSDLPKHLRDLLPMSMLRIFEPKRPPMKGNLCLSVCLIVESTGLQLELDYEPLLLKVCKELILPPEIYVAVKRIIEMKNIDLKVHPSNMKNAQGVWTSPKYVIYNFPEIKLISIMICVNSLYFISAHSREGEKSFDWKKWTDSLKELNLDETHPRNFTNVLSSLLISKDSVLDVIDWDEKQTNQYLDWFTKGIVEKPSTSDLSLQEKRLYDIFPLPEDDDDEDEDMELENQNYGSRSIEAAYQGLLESKTETPAKLKDEEVIAIESLLVENLFMSFGVTSKQLEKSVRFYEHKYFTSS